MRVWLRDWGPPIAFVLVAFGLITVQRFAYPIQSSIYYQYSEQKKNSAYQDSSENRDNPEEALARYTLWLVLFTGVLAIATIGLGIATYGLYLTGERQFKVVVAQSRAHIAISLKSFTFTPVLNNRPIIEVAASALNAGGTPALRFGFAFHIRLLKWPLPDNYEIEWPSLANYEERVGAVLPNQTIPITGGHGVTIDLERVARLNMRLYVIGIARYEDVFGNKRETRICGAAVQTFAFLNACLAAPIGQPPTSLPEMQFEGAARGNIST